MRHAVYGLKVGASLLGAGALRLALPWLVKPVSYWRTVEYDQTCSCAEFCAGQRVLDIGSPKLLALYLAEVVGVEVWATDIEPYFLDKLARARAARGLSEHRLHLEVQDGRKLGFPDRSFDRVYSISVLEHIPGEGDSACVREIARVLRPGGRAVLTVPFSPAYREEFTRGRFYWAGSSTTGSQGTFYQRRYAEADLRRRLIEPTGLALRTLQFIGETAPTPPGKELSDYLPDLSGPVQPLLSKLLHTRPVPDWRTLQRPLCAVVSLERPLR